MRGYMTPNLIQLYLCLISQYHFFPQALRLRPLAHAADIADYALDDIHPRFQVDVPDYQLCWGQLLPVRLPLGQYDWIFGVAHEATKAYALP